MKNSTRTVIRGIFIALFALGLAPFAEARTWTSTEGKPLQAIFLGIDGANYKFKTANGTEITVPKDRFIKADQEAAERLNKIGDDSYTLASARKLDLLLATQLKKQGFASFNKPLPDDLFVRRVYLDIIGRIPTRDEFIEFAESAREDKRAALIDELLLRPGYSSHMFNYFADMFRLHATDFNNGVRMDPYVQWWRDQLALNTPYDEIVSEMITAQGNVGQTPASGFLLRDTGMEFDAFANFGQVMLGIDISCAQCHDHPFDEWTQIDFYKMAAFFGNTQREARIAGGSMMSANYANMPNAPENWIGEMISFAEANKGINMKNPDNSRQFRYYLRALGWNVTDNENMETKLPHDFRGSGGKPNDVVDPRTLVGKAAKTGGKTRRQGLAEWLTAPENPRFAIVIANRMWQRAFGRAMMIPVNDFNDDQIAKASQPEALKFVTREMIRVGYDLREFMRILYNTRAYQSISTAEEPDWADDYYFSGPILRRMRAEQAWDSLMLLSSGPEIDEKKGADGSFYKALLDVDFKTISNEAIWERYELWKSNRGNRMGNAMIAEAGVLEPVYFSDNELRASELPQPYLPGSLLDTFGQSDRIITDDHNFDGSVPQVLALMNGSVTSQMTGISSKIVNDLEELDGPGDQVRGVFFTLLNRYPDDEELKIGMTMIEDYGDDGISDLAWSLMNSPEFLFIQ